MKHALLFSDSSQYYFRVLSNFSILQFLATQRPLLALCLHVPLICNQPTMHMELSNVEGVVELLAIKGGLNIIFYPFNVSIKTSIILSSRMIIVNQIT